MKTPTLLLIGALLCGPATVSGTPPHAARREAPERAAAAVLAQMLHDNDAFVRAHDRSYFEPFEHEQHPRATLVACADSRFHLQDIDSVPDGDVFEVRNIGNQIDSSEGTVQYAMRHLHTPLLLIVGHVGCGAVRAAMEDYSDEPPALRRELDGLHLSIRRGSGKGTLEQRWLENVRNNVHQQVSDALHEYQDEIHAGRLYVVGAIYDFRDDMKGGRGRLHIINVNGDTRRMAESALLREVRRLTRPADNKGPDRR